MSRTESDRERCRPHEAGQADPGIERVRIACRYIDEQPGRRPTLAELGAEVGSSPYHLQRTFKRVLGLARCFNKGWKHFVATVGATVFAHNLLVLAREHG